MVCWAAWVWPFAFRARRVKGRQASVTVRRGMWGLALETAGLALAWLPGEPAPGAGRVIASMALAPAGAALAWWAVEHLGTQWRIQAGLWPDHKLVRTGPYGLVRHPVYASMLALLLATGLLRASWPQLAAALALYLAGTEIRVRIEDGLLASRFGGEFESYRRAVAAYLPPLR